jgi:hypothetical protein
MFYLIWCPIAQESSLGRKRWILGENSISRDLLPDNVRLDPDNVRPVVWVSGDLHPDNVWLNWTMYVIVGWVPIFREVWGKSIGGDLDVADEGSEQCRFEPMQSLHHGSVGYQPVLTRIGLAKKALSLQANREHKQEQERIILNCRWIISSRKLGSYKPNVGETVLDRLI